MHGTPSEEVNMEVINSLTAVGPGIDHYPVPLLVQVELTGDLPCGPHQVVQKTLRGGADLV